MKNSDKYWLVGATWGSDDLFARFIANDEWILGWTNTSDGGWPAAYAKAQTIQPGDIILIKKWCGGAAAGFMRIRARGVVLNTSIQNGHVHCVVDWQDVGNEYIVDLGGCRQAINGPFEYGAGYDDWLDRVLKRPSA